MLIDFQNPEEACRWQPISDAVMGGCSVARLRYEEGRGVFEGEVSLANNGGFASVRRAPEAFDSGSSSGLALRVRGDGRRYQLRLKTDDAFDGILYRACFQPRANHWQELTLPWSAFEAAFRGRVLREAPALSPARVRQFGLMTGDKRAGPFRLELVWIRLCH
ncbi:CIA30 family protein [Motiliproteus sp. SC1-56]|uniref:CIA30 family protein n=1 Tax=Motiliproteus sp. SC1-56 TaxID=2799565 RepID=UPI001A90A237|nr:CIA30 family protein [Motiliproteus sp. SC1-56]